MICLRDGGTQMPDMIRKYSNKGVYTFYQIFCSLLLLLVGAVFIYTPGDIAATQVFGFDGAVDIRVHMGDLRSDLCILPDRDSIPDRQDHRADLPDLRRDPVCSPQSEYLSGSSRSDSRSLRSGRTGMQAACAVRRLLPRKPLYPDLLHHGCVRYPLRIPLHADGDHLPYDEEREAGTYDVLQHDGRRRIYRYGMGSRRNGRLQPWPSGGERIPGDSYDRRGM